MVAGARRPQLSMVSLQRFMELRAGHHDDGDCRRQDRRQRRCRRQDLVSGRLGPLPARSFHRRPDRAGDQLRIRRRLVCRRIVDRDARRAGGRARQGRICAGRSRQAESVAALCRRAAGDGRFRDAADDADRQRARGRRDDRHPGRRQLGRRRLCDGNAVPARRGAGIAHAGPRHRRQMADRRSGRQEARRIARHRRQDPAAPDAVDPGLGDRPAAGDRRLCHGRGGRSRHPQPHQLSGARSRSVVLRPAPCSASSCATSTAA